MKTDAEKRAFLEAEGWMEEFSGWWKPGNPNDFGYKLYDVCTIATKRKAARDRSRIKKSGVGFWHTSNGWCRILEEMGPQGEYQFRSYTRQEAIQYLDRMENEK